MFIHTFYVKIWFNQILKYQIQCRQTKLKEKVLPVLNYITNEEAFQYPGGVPTSMVKSGQQWDLRWICTLICYFCIGSYLDTCIPIYMIIPSTMIINFEIFTTLQQCMAPITRNHSNWSRKYRRCQSSRYCQETSWKMAEKRLCLICSKREKDVWKIRRRRGEKT